MVTALPAPAHIYQLDGSPWGPSGCMGAAGAMALDAYTGGAIRPTMNELRSKQDDQSGGIGLDDVATAWKRGWQQSFVWLPAAWPSIIKRLDAGKGAVVTVNYRAMGGWRAPGSTFGGAHALYLQRTVTMGAGDGAMIGTRGILLNDPLRRAAAVVPASVVQRAYTGGAGWGAGSYAGTPASSKERERALAALQGAGLPTSPDSYVFTAADAATIAQRIYGIDPSLPLGKTYVERWTGKTIADWIAGGAASSQQSQTLDAIGAALNDLPGTLQRSAFVAGLVALALLGVFLTFREPLTLAVPALRTLPRG